MGSREQIWGESHCWLLRYNRRNRSEGPYHTWNIPGGSVVCLGNKVSALNGVQGLRPPPLPHPSPWLYKHCEEIPPEQVNPRLLQLPTSLHCCKETPTHSSHDHHNHPQPEWGLISCYFSSLLPGWGTDVWGWPKCRDGTKNQTWATLAMQLRKGTEISSCSCTSHGLSSTYQIAKSCICGVSK